MIELKSTTGETIYVARNAKDVRAAVTEAVKKRADLGYANLGSADLGSANLRYANLRYANLGSANLGSADLRYADLRYADLGYADLRYANLGYADLGYADLGYADLGSADLGSANLRSAVGLDVRRVNELLLLRDQVGKIRAYKLVLENGQGPYNGGIIYEVGGSYGVADADTNDEIDCAAGINLATLPWCCREWKPGYRILLAEFTAKDIAAIPNADGKFRVHRCKIVRELDVAELGLV